MAELGPLNMLLQNYLSATEGSEAVFILRRNGVIVTSIIRPIEDEKEIASLTTLIGYIADVTFIDFETGYFRKSMQQISTPGKGFIFRQIDPDNVLITICDETAKANKQVLTAYSVYVANKVNKIFKGEHISPEIPKTEDKVRKEITPKAEYVFKIVIIGDAGVGKTTTTMQFAHAKFQSEYKPTIGVSLVKNEYWIGDDLVTFQIWDIAGQSLWKDMRRIYYSGAQAALILYDVTRPPSFTNVSYWHTELKTFLKVPIPCILCANKIDLVDLRKVERQQGEELADELELIYIETSAKTSRNIDAAFQYIGEQLIKEYHKAEE